jgi:hypothetical protein
LIYINPVGGPVASLAFALWMVWRRLHQSADHSREIIWNFRDRERKMKLSIALAALLAAGFVAASSEKADAVVYCQYVEYPAGCTARAGVVLRPRPVARAVAPPASVL